MAHYYGSPGKWIQKVSHHLIYYIFYIVFVFISCLPDAGAYLIAQMVKNRLQCRRPRLNSWVENIRWRRDRLPTSVFLGFSCGSAGKEYACNAGDLGLIPGLGRSSGKGKGFPLQCSDLENSIDCIVHGVAKSGTWLSGSHFHFPDAVM